MKFIYFGSSGFSLGVITTLYENGFIPELIVSQPDKPKGRGLKMASTLVSDFAVKNNIPLMKSSDLKSEDFLQQLKNYESDFLVIADYGKLIPEAVLKIARFMPLCAHPSLLPRYRGSAPINWALLNGDQVTGISIFKVENKIDTGDVIVCKEFTIKKRDDVISLTKSLSYQAGLMLIKAMKNIIAGNYQAVPQDETKASYDRKLTKADGKINWQLSAHEIFNLIRAVMVWPTAYTYYKGKQLKIIEVEVINEEPQAQPGSIIRIDKSGFYVACGQDILKISLVKLEGKSQMTAYNFTIGHELKVADILGK